MYAHPSTNPGMVRVSLDLGIVWQGCMCGVYGHPTTVPGWSDYLWNLRILFYGITGHPSDSGLFGDQSNCTHRLHSHKESNPELAAMNLWPGRGRSPGPRVAALGAWPVPWASCGRRGGVASPLGLVWKPLGVAGPLGLVWPQRGRGRSPGPRVAAVGAWPVPWSSCAAVGA